MSTESAVALKLRQRLNQLEVLFSRLDGVRSASQESLDEAIKLVSEAKARQALHPEMLEVFKALQKRTLGRAVGVYEQLLSLILQDVLPEEGTVRLLVDYKNNSTSLEIVLQKPNGRIEDILDGNGGAVTNILSAGLRFAALARSDNRALLVLDEPDCWLKPTRVPAFLKVISEVAANGVQTFFITHHDLNYSEGDLNVVEFYHDEITGIPGARLLPPVVRQWADDSEEGIRRIELINFGPHIHTVIPCFPGATAFIGDNNLGKSFGMNGALRAVGYGISSDSQINHEANEASIVYHIENNKKIVWTRYRDKSPSVIYRLYEGSNPKPIEETRQPSRNQAPEWVVKLLGIRKIDDLDVQLRSQKTPVFLLDESGARQAKLLAVGKEASYNEVMSARYEQVRNTDREAVRSGETTVIRMTNKLKAFTQLDTLGYTLSELTMDVDEVVAAIGELDALLNTASVLESTQAKHAVYQRQLDVLSTLAATPVLIDTQELERILVVIRRNFSLASATLPSLPHSVTLQDAVGMERLIMQIEAAQQVIDASRDLPKLPVVPELLDVQSLADVGIKLSKLEASRATWANLQNIPALAHPPELIPLAEMEELAIRITRGTQELLDIEKDAANTRESLAVTGREIAKLTEELGGVCPLCQNPMTNHTHEAAQHG